MNGSAGCFTYLFLVSFSFFGFVPLGRHSTDFSADGNQVVYAHNLKEVRILDTATRKPGPIIYTSPEGYIVDSVHWSQATGEIYAVIHNAGSCDNDFLAEYSLDRSRADINKKWNVRLLRLDTDGKDHETITDRNYYCPTYQGIDDSRSLDFITDSSEHVMLNATYQNFEKHSIAFKPVGWETGTIYFVEPEEIGKPRPVVTRMDLRTGKSETAFTLPPNGNKCLLSDDGQFLICMLTNSEKEEDVETAYIHIVLYDVRSGKELFTDLIDVETDELGKSDKEKDLSGLYGNSLILDLDNIATVDTRAERLFYIKMNMKTRKTSLISLNIITGVKKTLLEAQEILAPILVPQRNAILVTTIDSPAFSKLFSNLQLYSYFPYKGQTTLSLVGYNGKIISKHRMPPFLAPLRTITRPEASVSPDGRFIVAGIEHPGIDRSSESPESFAVIPMLIDIDHGSYKFVITEPRDKAAVGKILYDMEMNREALVFLEDYIKNPGPGSPDIDALYSLFFIYKDSKNPEYNQIYETLISALSGGEASGSLRFALGYINFRNPREEGGRFVWDDPFLIESIFWYEIPGGQPFDEPLPGMSKSDLHFIQKVLSLPENRDSGIAEYLLGRILMILNKPLEAVPHFEHTLEFVSFPEYCDMRAEKYREVEDIDPKCGEKYNFDIRMSVYDLAGEIYKSAGMTEKVVKYYSLIIKGDTESEFEYCCSGMDMLERHEARATANEKLKRYDEALMDYQILLDNSETNLANLIQGKQTLKEEKPKKCDSECDEDCVIESVEEGYFECDVECDPDYDVNCEEECGEEVAILLIQDGEESCVSIEEIVSLIKSEKAKIELYRRKIAWLKKRLKK